jgi:hypothetical protein
MRSATITRCSWASVEDPLMLQYHDREWGVPVHDDRKHFEFLVLEGAQAGLSLTIVLKKREGCLAARRLKFCGVPLIHDRDAGTSMILPS